MTLVYNGNKTVGQVLPQVAAAVPLLFSTLEPQLAAVNQSLAAQLPDPPPGLSSIVAALSAMTQDVGSAVTNAQVMTVAGFDLFTYSGNADQMGGAVAATLQAGDPSGGHPTDACNALVFLTADATTWTALQQAFAPVATSLTPTLRGSPLALPQALVAAASVAGLIAQSSGTPTPTTLDVMTYAGPVNGLGAALTVMLADAGQIIGVTVDATGDNYTDANFDFAFPGGTGGTGTATVTEFPNLTAGVTSAVIDNPGTGYTSGETFTLVGGGGNTAQLTYTVSGQNPGQTIGPVAVNALVLLTRSATAWSQISRILATG